VWRARCCHARAGGLRLDGGQCVDNQPPGDGRERARRHGGHGEPRPRAGGDGTAGRHHVDRLAVRGAERQPFPGDPAQDIGLLRHDGRDAGAGHQAPVHQRQIPGRQGEQRQAFADRGVGDGKEIETPGGQVEADVEPPVRLGVAGALDQTGVEHPQPKRRAGQERAERAA